jgi:hypothetical protein
VRERLLAKTVGQPFHIPQNFNLYWSDYSIKDILMSFIKNPVVALGFLFGLVIGFSCSEKNPDEQIPSAIELLSVNVGIKMLSLTEENKDLPTDQTIMIRFKAELDTASVRQSTRLNDKNAVVVPYKLTFLDNNSTVSLVPSKVLAVNSVYTLTISNLLKGKKKETFAGLSVSFKTLLPALVVQTMTIDSKVYYPAIRMSDITLEPEIKLNFSDAVTLSEISSKVALSQGTTSPKIVFTASADKKSYTITPESKLKGLAKFKLEISPALVSENGHPFEGFSGYFYTKPDPTPKFPLVSDNELLTLVQRQTFRYFWDFGHPTSGLARERNTSGDIVTTGGSGFGLMAMVVAMERGFITRTEGLERLKKIIDFLATADRFHGAWPHWLNGATGKVQPFSPKDNGGDLVETSYLVAGLLTVRQYLNSTVSEEKYLIDKINDLNKSVEWDWYTKEASKVLYWHWSPNYGWEMNHQIKGYNEALITYIMAASSPSHTIAADVYDQGWAGSGAIKNGKSFYGIKLPLGYDYGGPLFFAQYSFLGINPNGLSDKYANYLEQNVNHSLINRAHCINNPNNFVGYSASCWGLTASDNNTGYSAHSPTNDLGIISPTAAISSIPYTPTESLEALKFFYYTLGDRLWGEYGFYDAINLTDDWTATSTLAIDQGPIIVMIENYRTGLLWNLLMSAPEVKSGLTKLGFTYKL